MNINSSMATGESILDQYQVDQSRFAKGDELGKDQFLQLLVAQLNNQDPLSPQENGEFIAQLAQFSTVEGIENLNKSMESLLGGYQSSQALQASSLVGRSVTVPTSRSMVDTAVGMTGELVLNKPSEHVSVSVYSDSGSLITNLNMGAQKAGLHKFTWDGTDGNGNVLPPGRYKFEANAVLEGENKQLATLLPANVDSVSLGMGKNGDMVLNLSGLGSIELSEVFSIGR
ncbi:MAG: flagellar hook assembly protein FlgD [Pseudomonadaceae bacterium]|nr:MAG: flagellar hook assembly protein FlgD [Pseudomonadaceae bacterium]